MRISTISKTIVACALALISAIFARPTELTFNQDIRSILSQNCFQCHGPDANSREAGLRLDEFESATADNNGVRAIVPGKPADSEVIARIYSNDIDEVMPPPEAKLAPLTPKQKESLSTWISQGAKYEKHWAYIPPVRPETPTPKNDKWSTNDVDKYILRRLSKVRLQPSKEADRKTLIRRLSLDLTGLPPTPEQADAFAKDKSPNAYGKLVDQLLDSKAYGEHWARMWLDLARYADSAGYADDQPRTIWGYRDWVIRAFNRNQPFDHFTIEQIAGDLLKEPTNAQLTATAFHRNTQTNNEGGTNDEEFRNAAIVDRVNTTMAVWMGTTMACAQCHDHKYDPLSQEEYFQLFAILNNTQDADRRDESPTLKVFSEDQKKKKQEMMAKVGKLEAEVTALKARTPKSFQPWLDSFSSPAETMDREFKKTGENEYTLPLLKGTFEGLVIGNSQLHLDEASFALDHPDGTLGQEGRYVRVTNLVGSGFLHLAEVQVFSGKENLAFKGKAKQISTDFGGPANLANDGNTNGDYAKKSVSHTGQAKDPWWEVDLGKVYSLSNIVVWNRMDAGTADRMQNFRIEIFDNEHNSVWNREIKKTPNPSHAEQLDSTNQLAVIPFPRPGQNGWYQFGKALNPKPGQILRIRSKSFAKHPPNKIALIPKLPTRIETALPKPIFTVLSTLAGLRTNAQYDQLRAHHVSEDPKVKNAEKALSDATTSIRNMKPYTSVPILREMDTNRQRKTNIQVRGNFLIKDKEVKAGLPSIFHKSVEQPTRLDLANWLVSPSNPLTARVVANRYWESLFGTGIVASSEEFGSQGELPTHPELLDWLATELVRLDWDLKKFLKLLVTSSTYKQDARATKHQLETDPFNRFLGRGPRLRLTAEMVRDQALLASGLLSRKMYGPPIKPPQPNMGLKAAFGPGLDWQTSKGEDKFRRGIYIHWRRTNPYPSMVAFDAPNRFVCNVRRTPTNTPLQALVTLNDPVYVEAAQALARRMIKDGGETDTSRLRHGFRLCLTREPSAPETKLIEDLLVKARKTYEEDTNAAKIFATEPIGPPPTGVESTELAAYTVAANILLNLDEVFQKR